MTIHGPTDLGKTQNTGIVLCATRSVTAIGGQPRIWLTAERGENFGGALLAQFGCQL
jgi:hypothetical protein